MDKSRKKIKMFEWLRHLSISIKNYKNDVFVLLYIVFALALLFFEFPSTIPWDVFKSILVLSIIILPLKMTTYYKAIHTIIAALYVWTSSKSIFSSNSIINISAATILTIILFLIFLANIVLVIKDLYTVDLQEEQSVFFKKLFNFIYRIRFVYIFASLIVVVGVILKSYEIIYQNLYSLNPGSFTGQFDALYISFTTFFTIGYGDIVPVGFYARTFIMSEMALAYIVTTLFVPILIIALIKLFNEGIKGYE